VSRGPPLGVGSQTISVPRHSGGVVCGSEVSLERDRLAGVPPSVPLSRLCDQAALVVR
jgi:hypothetical protein